MQEIPILNNEEFWSQIAIDDSELERQRLQQLLRSQKRTEDAMPDTDTKPNE